MYPVNTQTLSQTKIVNGGPGIECSFAGGCLLDIQTNGVSSKLAAKPKDNYITVCGERCEFSETSTSSSSQCRVPGMPTSFSNSNFGILTESEDLKSGNYFGSNANYLLAFDDNNGVGPNDNSASCHIGMKFNPGFVGILSQVKFFLNNVDLATFNGNLVFQGSNDLSSWTDLYTADGNIHEGWNYKKFDTPSTQPSYRAYRFFGKTVGSCNIKEIKFAGVKAIQDSNPTRTCPVSIIIDGAAP